MRRRISREPRSAYAEEVTARFHWIIVAIVMFIMPYEARGEAEPLPARAVARLGTSGPGLVAVAVSQDGDSVATADVTGTVRIWRARTGKLAATIRAGETTAFSLDFSPDGSRVATGGSDGTLRLWHAATGAAAAMLQAHGRETWAVRFSPDGNLLATGGGDGAVYVWDVRDDGVPMKPRVLRRPEPGRGAIAAVGQLAFSPDGGAVAWAHQQLGAAVFVWDPHAGRELARLQEEGGFAMSLVFSPDAATLVTAGNGGRRMNVWETATWRLRQQFDVRGAPEFPGAISADGRLLWTVSGADVYAWDLATGRRMQHLAGGHRRAVTAVAAWPSGRKLVSADSDGVAVIWEVPAALDPAAPAPQEPLAASRLEQLWGALAAEDVRAAYDAMVALAQAPRQAVPYLRNRLRREAPVDEKAARRALDELDADDFTVRERATRALAELGEGAEALLRERLAARPSPEAAQRIELLLEALRHGATDPETLRVLRGIEVLERVGDGEALAVLRGLAGGGDEAGSRLKARARAAVRRLERERTKARQRTSGPTR